MAADLTQPQLNALAWLATKPHAEYVGSMFETYYAERWAKDYERATGNPPPWSPGLGRCRAWWRTGGAMLRRLEGKGMVRRIAIDPHSYAPRYVLTEAGLEAAQRAARH